MFSVVFIEERSAKDRHDFFWFPFGIRGLLLKPGVRSGEETLAGQGLQTTILLASPYYTTTVLALFPF